MPEVATTTPASNGAGAPSVRERVADQLRAAIAELADRRDQVAGELAVINGEIKTLERSLAPLVPKQTSTPRPKGSSQTHRSMVGPERLAVIEAAIRELAAGDEEFRQIDVVKATGITSSVMGSAFSQLTDASVIRLARRKKGPGGGNYFRLTRPALRDAEPTT
jgi:hypothetical protein